MIILEHVFQVKHVAGHGRVLTTGDHLAVTFEVFDPQAIPPNVDITQKAFTGRSCAAPSLFVGSAL